jgi:hypothetical protein
MRKTLRQIERELKTAKHCTIYEEELSRVWPDDGNQREQNSHDLVRNMALPAVLSSRFVRHFR